MKHIFNWIISEVFFTSSYGLVLGLGIQKNPFSNAGLGKIREHGSAHGHMENVTSIISQGKCSMPNEQNSGDTSHQALTKFIFFRNFIQFFGEMKF